MRRAVVALLLVVVSAPSAGVAAATPSIKISAKVTAAPGPRLAGVPVAVAPAAKGLTGSDKITSYTIDFGDHHKIKGVALPKHVSHTYVSPGRYTVAFSMTDRHRHVFKATLTMTIAQVTPIYSADGTGDAETPTVPILAANWTVAYAWNCTATYTGVSNFIVESHSSDSDYMDFFANELSAVGSAAQSAQFSGAGTAYLDIQTLCSWHVDVYPAHVSAPILPTAPLPTATTFGNGGTTTSIPITTPVSTPLGSPTALCKDGTYSYSQTRSGTCSHHGGVAEWL